MQRQGLTPADRELFSEIEKERLVERENKKLVVDFNSAKAPPRAPVKRQPKPTTPPEVQVKWSDSFVAIAEEYGIELDDEPLDEDTRALMRDALPTAVAPARYEEGPGLPQVDTASSGENHVTAGSAMPLSASILPAPVRLSPQRGSNQPCRSETSIPTPESGRKRRMRDGTSSLSHADYFQKIMGVSVTALSRSPVLKVGSDRINALRSPTTPSRLQEFDLNATRASPVPRSSPIQQAREGLLHSSMASTEAVVPSEQVQPPEEISQFSQFSASSGTYRQRHHKRTRSRSSERTSNQNAPRKRRRRGALSAPNPDTPEVKEELLSGISLSSLDSQFDASGDLGDASQLTPAKSSGSAPSQLVDSQGRIGRWPSSASTASELRMKAHSQRLKANRSNSGTSSKAGEESDEELLNEALQLVAKLEGECRYKQRTLAKIEAQYRAQEQELRKMTKKRDSLKKKAVSLQKRILAAAAAADSIEGAT